MQSTTSKVIIWSLLIVLGLILVARAFFIGYYRIPQNGMYPTLPAGSRLFIYKRAYSAPAAVKRGDIIIFVRDEDSEKYHYTWRVIGLPGDKIEAIDASLKVNGRELARERLREVDGRTIYREQLDGVAYEIALAQAPPDKLEDASLTVPTDHFFVMGDNRFNAFDSRSFGPIPFKAIVGKKL